MEDPRRRPRNLSYPQIYRRKITFETCHLRKWSLRQQAIPRLLPSKSREKQAVALWSWERAEHQWPGEARGRTKTNRTSSCLQLQTLFQEPQGILSPFHLYLTFFFLSDAYECMWASIKYLGGKHLPWWRDFSWFSVFRVHAFEIKSANQSALSTSIKKQKTKIQAKLETTNFCYYIWQSWVIQGWNILRRVRKRPTLIVNLPCPGAFYSCLKISLVTSTFF